jgi:hypothetical protein
MKKAIIRGFVFVMLVILLLIPHGVTSVIQDSTPPDIELEKPVEHRLYILGREVGPFPVLTLIIGPLIARVNAEDNPNGSGMDYVEFNFTEEFGDVEFLYKDYSPPYESLMPFGWWILEIRCLTAIAYDRAGNSKGVSIQYFKWL